MGAGDIWQTGVELMKKVQSHELKVELTINA